MREHGVDENTIEQIRTDDRADFNSNRRFYHWTSDFGEYLEGMADREQNTELKTVSDLLDEIEDETLYRALLNPSVTNLNTLAHISLLAVAVAAIINGADQSYRKLKTVKRIA